MPGTRRAEDGSQLFLVRLWLDLGGEAQGQTGGPQEGHSQWRGRVQHVMSGKAASFDDWPALVNLLVGMMPNDIHAAEHVDAKGEKP
ncbi:MAG TPA: hypothetical protein VEW94_05125 [Chloroflexia bacterium]|nr:hypothetical protein [Chloroflexia bacterium]